MNAIPLIEQPRAIVRWLTGLTRVVDHRANPMLVRCLRQELRSRAFVGIFILLLVVAVISAIASAGTADGGNAQAGRELFAVLACSWSFVVLVQALTTFRAVTQERNEDTWDLVDLTGMGPRKILRGLLLANLAQSALYAAALAPFLVMAYLLRGLDLFTIAFALVVIPLGGVAAATVGMFCACLGNNKPVRAFLGGALGLGLVGFWIASWSFWFNPYFSLNVLIEGLRAGDAEIWTICGLFANLWLALVVAMLVLSGTLLGHRAANRSTAPRLLWYALWANGVAWILAINWLDYTRHGTGGEFVTSQLGDALAIAGFVGVLWAGVLGLFSVSEDFALTPRQSRSITTARGWRRPFMLLFGPGAHRGRLAFIVLALLSVGLGCTGALLNWLIGINGSADASSFLLASGMLTGYLSAMFVSSELLYRGPLSKWLDTPLLRRGFTLVMVAVWCLAPLLIAICVDFNRYHGVWIADFSPMLGTFALSEGEHQVVTPIIMMVIGALCFALLVVQGLRLRITTQRIAAREGDANPRGG